MARRGNHSRSFSRPAPRTKIWIGTGAGLTALPASTEVLVGVLNAAALALRPFTILRTHLLLHYFSDQIAATETVRASYGLQVVRQSASAVGISAVPAPTAEIDSDWFVWQAMADRMTFQTGSGYEGAFGWQYKVDSKAMRKVGPDDDIVIVASQDAAFGATVQDQGRMLIQLH